MSHLHAGQNGITCPSNLLKFIQIIVQPWRRFPCWLTCGLTVKPWSEGAKTVVQVPGTSYNFPPNVDNWIISPLIVCSLPLRMSLNAGSTAGGMRGSHQSAQEWRRASGFPNKGRHHRPAQGRAQQEPHGPYSECVAPRSHQNPDSSLFVPAWKLPPGVSGRQQAGDCQ